MTSWYCDCQLYSTYMFSKKLKVSKLFKIVTFLFIFSLIEKHMWLYCPDFVPSLNVASYYIKTPPHGLCTDTDVTVDLVVSFTEHLTHDNTLRTWPVPIMQLAHILKTQTKQKRKKQKKKSQCNIRQKCYLSLSTL